MSRGCVVSTGGVVCRGSGVVSREGVILGVSRGVTAYTPHEQND